MKIGERDKWLETARLTGTFDVREFETVRTTGSLDLSQSSDRVESASLRVLPSDEQGVENFRHIEISSTQGRLGSILADAG